MAPIIPSFSGLTSNVKKVSPPSGLPAGPVSYPMGNDDDCDDPNNGLYDYDDYYDYD